MPGEKKSRGSRRGGEDDVRFGPRKGALKHGDGEQVAAIFRDFQSFLADPYEAERDADSSVATAVGAARSMSESPATGKEYVVEGVREPHGARTEYQARYMYSSPLGGEPTVDDCQKGDVVTVRAADYSEEARVLLWKQGSLTTMRRDKERREKRALRSIAAAGQYLGHRAKRRVRETDTAAGCATERSEDLNDIWSGMVEMSRLTEVGSDGYTGGHRVRTQPVFSPADAPEGSEVIPQADGPGAHLAYWKKNRDATMEEYYRTGGYKHNMRSFGSKYQSAIGTPTQQAEEAVDDGYPPSTGHSQRAHQSRYSQIAHQSLEDVPQSVSKVDKRRSPRAAADESSTVSPAATENWRDAISQIIIKCPNEVARSMAGRCLAATKDAVSVVEFIGGCLGVVASIMNEVSADSSEDIANAAVEAWKNVATAIPGVLETALFVQQHPLPEGASWEAVTGALMSQWVVLGAAVSLLLSQGGARQDPVSRSMNALGDALQRLWTSVHTAAQTDAVVHAPHVDVEAQPSSHPARRVSFAKRGGAAAPSGTSSNILGGAMVASEGCEVPEAWAQKRNIVESQREAKRKKALEVKAARRRERAEDRRALAVSAGSGSARRHGSVVDGSSNGRRKDTAVVPPSMSTVRARESVVSAEEQRRSTRGLFDHPDEAWASFARLQGVSRPPFCNYGWAASSTNNAFHMLTHSVLPRDEAQVHPHTLARRHAMENYEEIRQRRVSAGELRSAVQSRVDPARIAKIAALRSAAEGSVNARASVTYLPGHEQQAPGHRARSTAAQQTGGPRKAWGAAARERRHGRSNDDTRGGSSQTSYVVNPADFAAHVSSKLVRAVTGTGRTRTEAVQLFQQASSIPVEIQPTQIRTVRGTEKLSSGIADRPVGSQRNTPGSIPPGVLRATPAALVSEDAAARQESVRVNMLDRAGVQTRDNQLPPGGGTAHSDESVSFGQQGNQAYQAPVPFHFKSPGSAARLRGPADAGGDLAASRTGVSWH